MKPGNIGLIITGLGIAALAAAPIAAQQTEVKTKTKIEVHKGESVKATGCVQERSDGLMLTDVAGDVTHSYILIGKGDELKKHVGHRVEIKGKAADRKDGKVVTETKTKVDGGPEQKTQVKSEGTDLGVPVIGVESVKMVAAACGR
jgi:hypothetical protein